MAAEAFMVELYCLAEMMTGPREHVWEIARGFCLWGSRRSSGGKINLSQHHSLFACLPFELRGNFTSKNRDLYLISLSEICVKCFGIEVVEEWLFASARYTFPARRFLGTCVCYWGSALTGQRQPTTYLVGTLLYGKAGSKTNEKDASEVIVLHLWSLFNPYYTQVVQRLSRL